MKKLLSVVLSLVLVFTCIAPCFKGVTAKAETNLITDGTFENYQVGFGLTNSEFHYISGHGINGLSWVDINSYDWTMSAYGKTVVTDASAFGGSKALQLNTPGHTAYKVVTVAPNTLYELTYQYYQEKQYFNGTSAHSILGIDKDATRLPIKNSNTIYPSGGGTGIGTSETDKYPAVSNITSTEITNVLAKNGVLNAWTTVKVRFNSGTFSRVAIPFNASNQKTDNVYATVLIDNLSLKKVPTAEVTVNTVGAGGIGGVATVSPNDKPLEEGVALTYKATVTHDYSTFLGWYKKGEDTPYKTDLTFTENYNSSTYEILEARFTTTVKNMIQDSNFENYEVGHNLQGDAANRWDSEGIKGNYATAGKSGWISAGNWMKMFVTDEKAASGTKSFSLQGGNSIGKVVSVEGNKNYTLSFKYYAPSGNKIAHVGVRDITGVTEFPFENSYYGSNKNFASLYQYTHQSSVVNDEWTKVSIDISTNSTTEKIGIFFAGNTIAADTFIYFDDIYLIETGDAADFSQINNQYKTQGRTIYKDGMPSLFYTASAFEFSANFEGDAIVNFQVDSLKDAFGEEHYLTVYIDGERLPDRLVIDKAGSVNVTVAEDLPKGDHTISIYRANENYQGKMFVRGVILPEGAVALDAPKNKDKYIEVVGDSITSGWGIHPYSGSETATSLREDGTKTYAFLTKEALDTDISVLSQSGIGIACHANGSTNDTMDVFYPVQNYSHGYKDAYNFSRQPNLVIINIGTNDNYALKHSTMSANEIKEKFKNFLYLVREKNPAANIVWVHGMMLSADSEMSTIIKNAVSEVGGEACKFYTLAMSGNQSAHAGHPDAAAHVAASERLVEFINEKELLADTPAVKPVKDTNLVSDGSFENTTAQPGGTLDNSKVIWSSGANYTSTTQNINSANFVGGVYGVGWVVKENTTYAYSANGKNENPTTPETPYGENMLMIRNRWQSLCKVAKVENNKDYILTYYYYATASNHNLNVSQPKLIGIEDVNTIIAKSASGNPDSYVSTNVEGQVAIEGYYSDTSDYGKWVKRTVIFNSKESEKVLIPFDTQNGIMFIDNIKLEEMTPVDITYKLKESARIEVIDAIDGAPVPDGSKFEFKVVSKKDIVSVTANGTVLEGVDGIYSFTVDGDTTIAVTIEGDENLPEAGKTADGKDLTKYDNELYTQDISSTDTVYHEVGLFYQGKTEMKLLYPISEVISVRNYGLDKHYVLGVDYEITDDGKLKILEDGAIPVFEQSNIKELNENSTNWERTWAIDETTAINTWGDDVIPNYGIAVTYKHNSTFADGFTGFRQQAQGNSIPNTLAKLENGQDLNIVFYGDSVTVGWSSSGLNQYSYQSDNSTTKLNSVNVKPYASTWANMFVENLSSRYDSKITAKNLALSGTSSLWGKNNIVTRLGLIEETPDLMVVAFGLNDAQSVSVEDYKANIKGIIENARSVAGEDTEFLVVSPFLPNINCECFDINTFTAYEEALEEIAAEDSLVGVVTVTSYFKEIIKSKEITDYLSTNINHGNDFANRIYAQCLIAAAAKQVKLKDVAGDINGDGYVDLRDDNLLRKYIACWDVEVVSEALDVNGDEVVNAKDILYLSKHLAGWEGYETLREINVVKTSVSPAIAGDEGVISVALNLNNIEKLGGNIAGFEITVDFDSTKLEYSSIDLPEGILGNANVISDGKLKIVGYTSTPITVDGILGTILFNIKEAATGDTEIAVTVDELTDSLGNPYTINYEGKSETATL